MTEDAGNDAGNWGLFRGGGAAPHEVTDWPQAPPWRRFGNGSPRRADGRRLPYLISDEDRDVVNTALHLHRPLLVTGRPGTGKSTLAHAVARELCLGEVLHWPVNSRTTLSDGLYRYDAVGRLRDASLHRHHDTSAAPAASDTSAASGTSAASDSADTAGTSGTVDAADGSEPDIGDYLRLGPLGTALLPRDRPRVLLVDELDKGDVDLPNDLLTVFEEGEFEIPELARLRRPDVTVRVTGGEERVPVDGGRVACRVFPVVVITSNGERDFPPAFLRRCVRLDLKQPDGQALQEIVTMHLGAEVGARAEDLIATFLGLRDAEERELATDQLLNAVHLRHSGVKLDQDTLREKLFRSLDEADA
ncbi:AAA family ATPase [Streptomyces sp. NPDC087851]|uniref:AAA family ATPase n=1 Tax=Streptomyces sp. NPDC087851 TaxID=3365810 RepID=UPI00382F992C